MSFAAAGTKAREQEKIRLVRQLTKEAIDAEWRILYAELDRQLLKDKHHLFFPPPPMKLVIGQWPKEHNVKDTTVINGVTLTRAQVEAALADLNKPVYLPPGTRVSLKGYWADNRFMVLGGTDADVLRTHYNRPGVVTVNLGTGAVHIHPQDKLIV